MCVRVYGYTCVCLHVCVYNCMNFLLLIKSKLEVPVEIVDNLL